jgi:hypothetical protein
MFNPHATFTLEVDGQVQRFFRTTTDWTKWRPSDPTSAHWYNPERLENLIASYVAAERNGGQTRTVREFVSEFRGLSGTAKQKQVTAKAGLERAYLHDLVTEGGQLDRNAVALLLAVMQQVSAPVKPEALGPLGEQHFRERLANGGGDKASFRYKRLTGIDTQGLPYLVECAFVTTNDPVLRGVHVGLNWSVPLSNPIKDNSFKTTDGDTVWGLGALLASNRISPDDDQICLALHLICPKFSFLDRGKGSVTLTFAESVGKAILDTTKEWVAIKKKQERNLQQAERMRERMSRGRHERTSVKDAAYAVIPEAYQKASGNGQYPANVRQIMYAARPAIQQTTGEALKDTYFTQTLLPDYIREHPEESAGWDVVYDARGHLWEPHTGYEFGIGTLGVREYLAGMLNAGPVDLRLTLPDFGTQFPTRGPLNRFGTILYVEKEGFLPLLDRADLSRRYDMAIMSSKGMGTTAVRTLLENLSGQVKILVLHDFDKSGFSIAGTLTRDTRRYTFTTAPVVIDLGLRLRDVDQWNLAAEEVINDSDPTENLLANGATAEEVAFLRGTSQFEYGRRKGAYKGRRVELNAFTSDQFVRWLESKLEEHQVRKVIPDAVTLEKAYRRSAGLKWCQAILEQTQSEVYAYADSVEVPSDLRERIQEKLAATTSQSWDGVIESLLPPVALGE